ncbi:hypothetical protein [Paragemmobacter aquarius]|uniref:hypothetical protein n=1 Tax=Paragemmobacter aquarius TaxID=2169400 RepID=UPI001C1F2644|nr:hypothetical protein [Gemmobacter aquarius]
MRKKFGLRLCQMAQGTVRRVVASGMCQRNDALTRPLHPTVLVTGGSRGIGLAICIA